MDEKEALNADEESKWCPDTWQWYTWSELLARYSGRWGEKECLDHWDWKMQQGCRDVDVNFSPRSRWKPLTYPHGVAHDARFGERRLARYLIFKPPGFDNENCNVLWPMLIFLHGHHEINQPEKVASLFSGRTREFDDFAMNNFYIVAPLVEWGSFLIHRDGHQFDIDGLAWICEFAIQQEKERLDKHRISITGYSMGADAAARLALQVGELFASAALFAGSYDWTDPMKSSEGVRGDGLRDLQIRCFHNEADSYIGVGSTYALLHFIKTTLGYDAPTMRKITIPYPSNVLTYTQHMQAMSKATSHLHVSISEFDGGSKSSWILEDAVHLADGHVCWPIVYANEASFGLFHWMLSCSREGSQLRPPVKDRNKFDMISALKLLADLKDAYGITALRDILAKLAARVGRDKFTFLMHAQQLIFEVQKPVLEKWGFSTSATGVLDMTATLSEHLKKADTPEAMSQRDAFQEKWDETRKILYGSMYQDCWLPSQERTGEVLCVFPDAVVETIRGVGQPFTLGHGVELHSLFRTALIREQARARAKQIQAETKKNTPQLTIDDILSMQADLRNAFAQPEFQVQLQQLQEKYDKEESKFAVWRLELVYEAQVPILIKYGFEGSRRGVQAMLECMEKFKANHEFRRTSDECNVLLELDHRFDKDSESRAASEKRAKAWKDWFKYGVWPSEEDGSR